MIFYLELIKKQNLKSLLNKFIRFYSNSTLFLNLSLIFLLITENISMKEQLNREIQSFNFSDIKINQLIYIKKFINRFSCEPYLLEKDKKEIQQKYGVTPDVTTWGDYFQVEIATENHDKDDMEFEKIIQTVVYDVLVAMLIFRKKDKTFIQDVIYNLDTVLEKDSNSWTEQEEEAYHLGVLYNYYNQMKLDAEKISKEDLEFFKQFELNSKVS